MPKAKSECPACVVSREQIEQWINDQELDGSFLVAMGVLSEEEYKTGKDSLEEFRVEVQENPPADANEAIKTYLRESANA